MVKYYNVMYKYAQGPLDLQAQQEARAETRFLPRGSNSNPALSHTPMLPAPFRDAGDGCSGLVWSGKLKSWICGGSLGLGYQLHHGADLFQQKTFNSDDSAVTAVAVHDNVSLLAHAAGDSVSLRSLDDLDELKEEKVVRRTLNITHLDFMADGKFL
jgi:hypothetical protein